MPGVSIDRLVLEVPGVSELQARRLATELAAGLSGAGGESCNLSAMRVDVPVPENTKDEELHRRILTQVLRELQRMR